MVPKKLYDLFDLVKAHSGKKIAIRLSHSNLSYNDLSDLVEQQCQKITAINNNEGPVLIHMQRTPVMVASILACFKLNRPYVPIDPEYPQQRKKLIYADLGMSGCCTQELSVALRNPLTQHAACLLYTSGSTGIPKGIELSSQGILNLIDWSKSYYKDYQLDCVLAATTICFDLSVFEIIMPLCLGKSIYLVDSVLDLISLNIDLPITLINTVPSAIREIEHIVGIPKSVNTINLAGESLSWEVVRAIYQHSNVKHVYNLWGPTEDVTYSTAYECSRNVQYSGAVPIGKPIKKSRVILVDGEIWLSGPNLTAGYTNKNTDKFIEQNGIKYFRTGDLAELNNVGDYIFRGRLDLQVKISGYRIEIEEIEHHLLSVDRIVEAAVVVISRAGNKKLVACYVTDNNQSDENLHKKLKSFMPHYMMPSNFVYMRKLPRLPNGKVSRQSLQKSILSASSDLASVVSFPDLLRGVVGKDIDCKKSLADLGVSSLEAIRILAECNQRWQHNLTLHDLIKGQKSIEDLTKAVNTDLKGFAKEKKFTVCNLSDSEARLYRVYNGSVHSHAYNVAVKYEIDQADCNIDQLKSACLQAAGQCHNLNVNYSEIAGQITKTYCEKNWEIHYSININQPFDLSCDNLARFCLQSAKDKYILQLCMPHVVIDAIGIDNFTGHISSIYNTGSTVTVNEFTKIDPLKTSHDFWMNTLKLHDGICPFSQNITTEKYDYRQEITVNYDLISDQCVAMTVPSRLMALLYLAIHRVFAKEVLTICTPVANRETASHAAVVGNYINTLPIPMLIDTDTSIEMFLNEFNDKLTDCLMHQRRPIDRVLAEITQDESSIKTDHLFDIIFSYLDFGKTLKLSGANVSFDLQFPNMSKAPLVVTVFKNVKDLKVVFEAQRDKVSLSELTKIIDAFSALIHMRKSLFESAIHSFSKLTSQDTRMIEKLASVYPITFSEDIPTIFRRIAKTHADRCAVIDGKTCIKYDDLYTQSLYVMSFIKKSVEPQSGIGINMTKTWRLIPTIMGIIMSGCYYVPLDPNNPKSRNNYIKSKSSTNIVITDSLFDSIQSNGQIDRAETRSKGLDDLAYMMFTSGTTGQPKGVAITQRNIIRLFYSCESWLQISHDDVWSMCHSYGFDFSVWEIFGPLLHGGALVIIPDMATKDVGMLLDIINHNSVTYFSQTPTALSNLLPFLSDQASFSPKYIISGGESLSKNIVHNWYQLPFSHRTRIVNMYGITETSVHSTIKLVENNYNSSCVGVPLKDVGVVLVDQYQRLVPVGVSGEIWVSGDGLCRGYVADPKLNSDKFVIKKFPDINISIKRYYRSGDLGYLNKDGELIYQGRCDKQIKVNGHRVETDEVVGALRSYKGITDSVILVKKSDHTDILCAYIRSSTQLNDKKLTDYLKEKLPHYAVPRLFMRVSEFPVTMNGKIDVSRLPDIEHTTGKLKTTVEETIKSVWASVLHTCDFEPYSNFFQVGGDSVKAVLLVNALTKSDSIKQDLSVVDVFRYPVLQQQIKHFEHQLEQIE